MTRPNAAKIVVRMPNWIGDLVMATPILADLRAAYTDAHITALCRAPIAELLQHDPAIDELIAFQKGVENVARRLRDGCYDLGVLLTHSFSSAWWFWQGNVKQRLGYVSSARRWLLNLPAEFPDQMGQQHLVITYKMLLEQLEIPPSETPPRLFVSEEEKLKARQMLRDRGVPDDAIVIGINPGAAYGSAKCWLPERFRMVAERLLSHTNVAIVFFGDATSIPLVEEIAKGLNECVINLAGKTSVRELMSAIGACDLLLTNDSGPMHIADALEVPVVALFGSTSEVVTGPYREGFVIHKHVSCSPCYERKCPLDFRCMTQITADEVYEAICSWVREASVGV